MRTWPKSHDLAILGYACYKAGMTHVTMVDDTPGSPSKGMEIFVPVTVLECPPLHIFGVRLYGTDTYGRKTLREAYEGEVLKKISLKQKPTSELEKLLDSATDASVLAVVFPPSSTGKKTPDILEISVGGNGKSLQEKFEFCKSLLGKEIHVSDVLRAGDYVDTIAVTKGKGWQGPVKRFGVAKQRRKATGKVRHVGTLGPWHPARVMYTVPQAGQMGYHRRTEYGKRIIKIGKAGENITPVGGFPHYGVVKNDFILLKGSVQGPQKRLIKLRKSLRPKPVMEPVVSYISLTSKQ